MLAAVVLSQVSLIPGLRLFGVVPDVVMVCVVLLGLRATVSRALVLALVGGIVMDISSGTDFGLHTGLLVVAALATGLVRRSGLTMSGVAVPLGLVTALTVMGALLSLAGVIRVLSARDVAAAFSIVLVELVVNLIIALGLRPVIARLVPDESALPAIG